MAVYIACTSNQNRRINGKIPIVLYIHYTYWYKCCVKIHSDRLRRLLFLISHQAGGKSFCSTWTHTHHKQNYSTNSWNNVSICSTENPLSFWPLFVINEFHLVDTDTSYANCLLCNKLKEKYTQKSTIPILADGQQPRVQQYSLKQQNIVSSPFTVLDSDSVTLLKVALNELNRITWL